MLKKSVGSVSSVSVGITANGCVYKKWRIRTPKLSIQHYTLIEKRMSNIPPNPPFFIHAVMRMCGGYLAHNLI